MTIALKSDSEAIEDNVTIPSIADDSSYSRYKDYDGFPLDSASGDNKDPNDWYEEPSGTLTKGSENSTEIPEMQIVIIPVLVIFIFTCSFSIKKNRRVMKFDKV
jgi:hypothetical protein